MARPLRLDFEGALWHVTARGNERKAIVRDDEDRETFVRILGAVAKRFGWKLHGWVLMPNHYHLVVETPRPTLSNGMKQLGGVYSQAFNRRWRRSGHLFQGRFFSLHVQRESHLMELLRYTALNPVRAGLVKTAEGWRWGSYRATAGLEARPPWLEVEGTLSLFRGRGRPETAWIRFVREASDYSPWEQVRHQVILGEDDLVQELRKRAQKTRAKEGIPVGQMRIGAIALMPAARRMAAYLAADNRGEAGGRDRALAALVLRNSCLATYRRIGELTGLTMWGARSLVERGRRMAEEGPVNRRRYAELSAKAGERESGTQ